MGTMAVLDCFSFTLSFPFPLDSYFFLRWSLWYIKYNKKMMKTSLVLFVSLLTLFAWLAAADATTATLRRSASPSLVLTDAKSRRSSASGPRAVRVLQAKQKRRSSSSSVSKTTFKGTATWFIPSTEGGSEGACGDYNEDNAKIVALVRTERI